MSEPPVVVALKLTFPDDSTPEEQEETARRLRQDLEETDVLSVEQAADTAAPPGAKGLPAGLDTLLVTLAGSGSILATVIGTISNWLMERKKCSVTLKVDNDEITVTNPSAEDQRKLIESWMMRHTAAEK
jgi:membrane-associated two-gene conflict system component 1 (EACC1)